MTVLQDLSLFQVIAYVTLIYSLYYIALVAYYLYFHPLARYPGPLLARISPWPSFYHALKGNRHVWLWQLQEVYGPVVRYRPDAVIFQTPDAFRTIYDTKANVKKAKQYQAWARHVTAQNTFTATDKTMHARKRRVLNAAFSDKALRSAEHVSIRHINRWCELLVENSADKTVSGEIKNMTEWSDYLVLDIFTELAFGKSFETKEPGDNPKKAVPHTVVQYLKFMYPITWSPFLDLWIWLKPKGLDKLLERNLPEVTRKMIAMVDSCLSRRIAEEQIRRKGGKDRSNDSKDLLHHLLRANDPEGGPGFTPSELQGEAEMLLSAGFDTTSAVIAAMFFYLTRNPSAYEKLAREIRQTFANVDEIVNGSRLSSCTYLRAVINETLRMSPPGAAEGAREVLPGGITVEGHFIKAGFTIGTAIYALQHDQEIFQDPFVFRPERWLVSENVSRESVAKVESACFPFSIGIRGCPGKRLAYQEMTTAMATVMLRMDFCAVAGDMKGVGGPELMWGRRNKTQWQVDDAMVATRDGPLIQFQKRSP